MAQARMMFPADFLWGTATSSYQVEGNNENSDWWAWEQADGRILHNQKSGLACNWWADAEADLNRAAEMGNNAHRLSLEWSRIEPEPGRIDKAALARYREILTAVHNRGMEPMVTLHHFSNPLWLVEKGDFNSGIVVEYFQRYVTAVVQALGDLIPQWITINEPMVYVTDRYLTGTFPAPQKTGWGAAMEATRNLLRCHAVAYHIIKEAYPAAAVSVAKNFPIFLGKRNAVDRWWAGRLDKLFNQLWMGAMVDGRLRWPLGRGKIKGLAGTFDFVGVNYYSRYYVKFPPPDGFIEREWGPEALVSDGSYGEVYPAGLFQVIDRARKYGKPIYITENGLPDEADGVRPYFLLTHLREIWRAISFNYPVMGYYHWSLVDNFEWDRGWTQRFGLIALDEATQERTWRDSGRLYAEICLGNCISSEMAEKYAPQLMETMFPG
ncbi:MAG TPA: glycoside hydrolase family 1 protein [Anaerolineae bacterium]|nr:glycoside hydrolase family 1 protein [Anaerolineae bacterium]